MPTPKWQRLRGARKRATRNAIGDSSSTRAGTTCAAKRNCASAKSGAFASKPAICSVESTLRKSPSSVLKGGSAGGRRRAAATEGRGGARRCKSTRSGGGRRAPTVDERECVTRAWRSEGSAPQERLTAEQRAENVRKYQQKQAQAQKRAQEVEIERKENELRRAEKRKQVAQREAEREAIRKKAAESNQ